MAQTRRARAVDQINDNHNLPREYWDEIVGFAEYWEDQDPPATHCGSDLDRLQGAWLVSSGRRQAEMLISGRHLTVHFTDGDIYMGSFTLGAKGRLATLDVRVEEGPSRHRGQPVLCIYELDGDTLRWCNAPPGEAERPNAFDEQNPHLLCLMFRREHRTEVR